MRKLKAILRLCAKRTQGQATIEYVLMLGSVLVILSAFLTAFHTDIARWFFTFIGYALSK